MHWWTVPWCSAASAADGPLGAPRGAAEQLLLWRGVWTRAEVRQHLLHHVIRAAVRVQRPESAGAMGPSAGQTLLLFQDPIRVGFTGLQRRSDGSQSCEMKISLTGSDDCVCRRVQLTLWRWRRIWSSARVRTEPCASSARRTCASSALCPARIIWASTCPPSHRPGDSVTHDWHRIIITCGCDRVPALETLINSLSSVISRVSHEGMKKSHRFTLKDGVKNRL